MAGPKDLAENTAASLLFLQDKRSMRAVFQGLSLPRDQSDKDTLKIHMR